MRIVVNNGTASVYTPYNAEFVKLIKKIGGRKWNASEKCWSVPEEEIDQVRSYMMDVYGETDIPDDEDKVTVRVRFNMDASELTAGITLFGRTVITAWGRDTGASVCDGVVLEEGKIDSGGSARNWRTLVSEGTVIKVRNVPRRLLDREQDYSVTIEEVEEKRLDINALLAEKEKILARLAEIDKLIEGR